MTDNEEYDVWGVDDTRDGGGACMDCVIQCNDTNSDVQSDFSHGSDVPPRDERCENCEKLRLKTHDSFRKFTGMLENLTKRCAGLAEALDEATKEMAEWKGKLCEHEYGPMYHAHDRPLPERDCLICGKTIVAGLHTHNRA